MNSTRTKGPRFLEIIGDLFQKPPKPGTRLLGLRKKTSCWCAAIAAGLVASGYLTGANAAVATNASATNDTSLEEIIVTAEKRQSTILDTSISITALTAEQLDARGIRTLEEIVQQVPGLSMRTGGPGMTEIEMRGLSSTGGVAPTVGFYLDDSPLTPPVTSFSGKTIVSPDLYDLSRVEVLRGPQGTLYGSGAMGGVVRLITNQPDLKTFSGSIDMSASGTYGGNTPNGTVNAAVNLPIIESKVALRLIGTEKWNSGWIDRIVDSPFPFPTQTGCSNPAFVGCARGNVQAATVVARYKDVNWEHTQSARAELLVQPSDALKILTSVFFQSSTQGGPNEIDVPPGPDGKAAHYQPADIREPYLDKFTVVSNTITGDLGFAQLTVATAYYNRNQTILSDIAEGYQNLFFLPNFLTEADQAFLLKNPSHQISEEIRLASEGDGSWKWIGGLFASREQSTYFAYDAVKGMCYLSNGGCAANPLGITYYSNSPYTIDQYAGFGEMSYSFSPWTATVGGRFFKYNSKFGFLENGIFSFSGNTVPTTGGIKGSNHGFNPKFNLSYEPSKDLNVYATVAQGFRTGGINLPIPVTGSTSCLPYLQAIGYSSEPYTYRPDKVWSYELGEKAQLFDHRFSINADIYYNRWTDVQQQLNLGCAYSLQVNAGTAVSYGPELEFSFRVTPQITIEASGTYTKATVSNPSATSGIPAGTPLLNVPQYSENTSIIYHTDLRTDLGLTARISNSLVGPTHDLAYANYELPSYDIINARIQLITARATYSLFANNVTNTRAQLTSNNTVMDFNIPSLSRVTVNQPVTVGVEFKYRF